MPARAWIGIDVAADGALLATVDRADGVIDVRRLWQPAGAAQLADAVRVLAQRARDPVGGVGLAARGAGGQALAGALAELLGLPVRAAGAGNCAALWSAKFGQLRGAGDAVLLAFGREILAGALVGGRLLHADGRDPDAAHVILDARGERCACGARGCAITVLGGQALARAAARAQLPADGQKRELGAKAAAGDPLAAAVLRQAAGAAAMLARAVALPLGAQTVALHWPEAGGGAVGQWVREQCAALLPDGVCVKTGQLPADAIACGAGLWAMRNRS